MLYTCMYVCVCVYIYIYTYIDLCIYICICMYIYIYIYIYIHIHVYNTKAIIILLFSILLRQAVNTVMVTAVSGGAGSPVLSAR